MRAHALLAMAILLLGCSTGGDLVNIGDNAWRLTTIDNTEAEAARVGIAQAIDFCGKQGKDPFFSTARTANDMPARHISMMEFQCTARGMSPEAQAEARLRGYQRDRRLCAGVAGKQQMRVGSVREGQSETWRRPVTLRTSGRSSPNGRR